MSHNETDESEEISLYEVLLRAYNGDVKQALSNVCEEIEDIFGDDDFSSFIRSVISKEFVEKRQFYVN